MVIIKKSHTNTVIAFNNSGIPLNRRSQSDLIDLAIMGRKSKNPLILNAFEEPLPSLDELIKMKMKSIEEKVSNAEEKDTGNKNQEGK